MTLTQIEYIVAVERNGSFVTAAEKCFVTQPTLSMMIHNLEEELGLRLFDRSRQPVVPTEEGKEVIKRARVLMNQVKDLKEYAGEHKGEVSGELRLGIIPTLAPYLLPLFLNNSARARGVKRL